MLKRNVNDFAVDPQRKAKQLDIFDARQWYAIGGALSMAIALLLLLGIVVGSWRFAVIELLLGLAAAAAGGLFGFLFGHPKTSVSEGKRNDGVAAVNYQPNTDLQQISDWLTKMLIGVGLVELRQINAALATLGAIVATALGGAVESASVVSQIVVVFFAVLGFVSGFLWTRLYYGPMQADIDRRTVSGLNAMFEEIKLRGEDLVKKIGVIASDRLNSQSGAGILAGRALAATAETSAVRANMRPDVEQKIKDFEALVPDWGKDPVAEMFKGTSNEANGRRLEASIVTQFPKTIVIDLRVISTDGDSLSGDAIFLLHPTFQERILNIKPVKNVADVQINSAGAFTAAAILDDGATVLTLDLSELPGAPKWFTEN